MLNQLALQHLRLHLHRKSNGADIRTSESLSFNCINLLQHLIRQADPLPTKKIKKDTHFVSCTTQTRNYLYSYFYDTFKTKSMIKETEDTSPALYFCQAAPVTPNSDITHAEPDLHMPTVRTRFGLVW